LFDGIYYSDNCNISRANTFNKPQLLEEMYLLDKRSTQTLPVALMIHDSLSYYTIYDIFRLRDLSLLSIFLKPYTCSTTYFLCYVFTKLLYLISWFTYLRYIPPSPLVIVLQFSFTKISSTSILKIKYILP